MCCICINSVGPGPTAASKADPGACAESVVAATLLAPRLQSRTDIQALALLCAQAWPALKWPPPRLLLALRLRTDATVCAGAGLTAPYSAEVEQEAVSTDASVLAMNITGGLPGSGVDGTIVYKVGLRFCWNCTA